jgi:2Fe-2S ferredoxin
MSFFAPKSAMGSAFPTRDQAASTSSTGTKSRDMVHLTFIEANGTRHETSADAGISVMVAARDCGIPTILAECGGSMTCATCHVHIDPAWLHRVGTPHEMESEMLEMAIDPGETSRLSCQVILTDELDGLVVHVPASQI